MSTDVRTKPTLNTCAIKHYQTAVITTRAIDTFCAIHFHCVNHHLGTCHYFWALFQYLFVIIVPCTPLLHSLKERKNFIFRLIISANQVLRGEHANIVASHSQSELLVWGYHLRQTSRYHCPHVDNGRRAAKTLRAWANWFMHLALWW